ncbi:hypothetical protein APASM_5302 [Actinosynnema pretiosum subsp. pretiosum]|nr:hypothetical protein APASM_5302 [Actinosynnema pretiosum subsp. pretiosum]
MVVGGRRGLAGRARREGDEDEDACERGRRTPGVCGHAGTDLLRGLRAHGNRKVTAFPIGVDYREQTTCRSEACDGARTSRGNPPLFCGQAR